MPTNICPANTACTNYTCNAVLSTCDALDLLQFCPDPTNQCLQKACTTQGGCTFVAKPLAQRQALCNDQSACTADSCNLVTGNCDYVPIQCTTSDICSVPV